ncbi:MAG: EscU/YscU/HrcU family type III secretion system export apparatus switch protein [Oscillospiraceae bacterium]|jgi:type III secretion system FlhB-like substrate exporter
MSRSDARDKREDRSKAVALRYRAEENAAPVVIASGYGNIADKIIGIAEEKGIPVFKDDSAASMLCMLEVGRGVPVELYEVIAAIYMQILTVSGNIKHNAAASEIDRRLEQKQAGEP